MQELISVIVPVYNVEKYLKKCIKSIMSQSYTNLEIIFADFLKRNVLDDIKKYEYKHLYLVANLPYYITTPILMKIIDENTSSSLTLSPRFGVAVNPMLILGLK